MAKAARNNGFFPKMQAFLRNETTQSIASVILFAGSVYMLIAMGSFLLSGGSDYSLLNQTVGQLKANGETFRNVCGQAGAQLADWMINRQFGLCSFSFPSSCYSFQPICSTRRKSTSSCSGGLYAVLS